MKGRYEARGLRVVSVSEYDVDEAESERTLTQKAAEEEKMTYPCFLDAERIWQKSAGIEGIPTFLIVDRSGKIRFQHKGKLLQDSDAYTKIASVIDTAIAESKPQ